MKSTESPLWRAMLALAMAALLPAGCNRPLSEGDASTGNETATAGDKEPLRIVVMDPLSAPLACACVQGYAQRQYGVLGRFLQERLGRPAEIFYTEDLAEGQKRFGGRADLVVGKHSVVQYDAEEIHLAIRPLAMLTGKDGATTFHGLFVVRHDDPAKTVTDLKGRRIKFGPKWAVEKHGAALEALKASGADLPEKIETSPGCNIAAIAMVEKEADAAVISSYAVPLLEGCDIVAKGALRVVGRTESVPFITAFATPRVSPQDERAIASALFAVREDAALLKIMESKHGFVPMPAEGAAGRAGARSSEIQEWPDWRGPRRDGLSPHVPEKLPARLKLLWKRDLTGLGLSGVAATERYVVVADKKDKGKVDLWRCLDAATGKQVWAVEYAAAGEMDYSNAARATPVIRDGLVYLLGALGDLHCVGLDSGRIVWKRNVVKDFGAELVTWGMCATPLVVDDKLIVNPGAENASVVALDRKTGKTVWQTPGREAAYSSFIVGTFGGLRQIVGYDAVSLRGWDPDSGKGLWHLVPHEPGDFNVPTPIDIGGKLLVSTENNGTRLYGFDGQGRINPKPLAANEQPSPDSLTPVVVDGLVIAPSWGDLYCLDLADGLKTLWQAKDEVFDDYSCLIAGNGHVLITTIGGELLLVEADRKSYQLVARVRLINDAEIWSHPALVGNRFYVRNENSIRCYLLS